MNDQLLIQVLTAGIVIDTLVIIALLYIVRVALSLNFDRRKK